MAKGLTPKQKVFVQEYLVDLNATQAAIRAKYSSRRAMEIGWQLLQKTTVRVAIQAAMDRRAARTEVTADRVVLEYARIAFADMRSFFAWGPHGLDVKSSKDLSENDSAAVAEITWTETEVGELAVRRQVKLKLHDKKGALDALAKHVRLEGVLDERKPQEIIVRHEQSHHTNGADVTSGATAG